MTHLSYVKLVEAVCVDGAMTYELRSGVASAIGIVTPSAGGNVLVPWHAVRWAVEAPPLALPPPTDLIGALEALGEAYASEVAAPAKAKRKR